MVQLSTTEHALIDDLLECLAIAMDQREDINPAYANKTKLQKLLFLAIEEFDLPLTYSWYLAGAVVPSDPVSPAGLQSAFDDLPSTDQPEATASEPASVWNDDGKSSTDDPEIQETVADFKSRLRTADSEMAVDPILFSDTPSEAASQSDSVAQDEVGNQRDEIIDFYERKLPDVWRQNTMQFLQNFYISYAPEQYRELYLQSTHLRTRLREVEQVVTAHLEDDQPDQGLEELAKAVGLEISDLHYSIRKNESLSATLDQFVRGTDFIEDGLMMLSQVEADEVTETHREVVQEMQEFFYYSVWRLPCLVISQETATGPSAETLRAKRQEELVSFDERLRRRCRKFEQTLERADLKPSYTDYEHPDDEISQHAEKLTQEYLE
jgi:hypothetical protein